MSEVSLRELAVRINAHLKRFESDPEINLPGQSGTRPFYHAHAVYVGGPKLTVSYVSYQHAAKLTKVEATVYLAWLDAGNIGRHWKVL